MLINTLYSCRFNQHNMVTTANLLDFLRPGFILHGGQPEQVLTQDKHPSRSPILLCVMSMFLNIII